MDEHFPWAIATNYQAIAAKLDLPDPDGRHVLAAAIMGETDVTFTDDLWDFPARRLTRYPITAPRADGINSNLFEADPEAVPATVRDHRAALHNPSRSVDYHLTALERHGLNGTAAMLRVRATES